MKTILQKIIAAVLLVSVIFTMPVKALAAEGSMGYEGGISTVNSQKSKVGTGEYYYSEMTFITGVPILLTGSLTIKKQEKSGTVQSTYTYRLTSPDNKITLTRVLQLDTTVVTDANGQITESTNVRNLTIPSETIIVGNVPYTLSSYQFTRSMLTDPQPAIKYSAGEFKGTKVYLVNGNNADTVTVTYTGEIYSYDQYWSATQTQLVNVMLESKTGSTTPVTNWGGSVNLVLSSTRKLQMVYAENEPDQISFDGGYRTVGWTESTLDYTARLPEFDKNNKPTNIIKTYTGRHTEETAPQYARLTVPDLKHLKGHSNEAVISSLFGLGVIPGTGTDYNANKYVTRREFVVMLINALKDIPEDTDVRRATTTTSTRSRTKVEEVSPFLDVAIEDPGYAQIKAAYDKGIVQGVGRSYFRPDAYITNAEAIFMIVSSLGLQKLAPFPYGATAFPDNDAIPSFARNAASVASTLGIYAGDARGYFNASSRITNNDSATLLYNVIRYMGDELLKDYRDRMLLY